VSLQEFLDPPSQQFALVKDGRQRVGQARDDQRGRLRAWNGDGLLVQRGEDVLDSRSAIRGAFGRNRVTSRRRPALRI
jgi:hypothetical protein